MIILKIETDNISYQANILSIQVRGSSFIKIWKIWDYRTEGEMLKNFIQWFLKEKDKVIIGYNLLKFDIPILLLKTASFSEFEGFSMKINRVNILDLFVVLTFLNKGRIRSLDYYCRDEIKKEIVSRDRIIELYKNKEYQELEKSLIKNLNAINELFLKIWKKIKNNLQKG